MRKSKFKETESENGRSMIEMLGVLAIIGVLSVGGIAGFSKAMNKYRINKAIDEITYIAGNARTFFKGDYKDIKCECLSRNKCEGIDTQNTTLVGCAVIRKAKILPEEMITLGEETWAGGAVRATTIAAITNSFGYQINIRPTGKSVYGDNKAFSIYYPIGDNAEACVDLLGQDWTNTGVKALILTDGGGEWRYMKTPVPVDVAVEQCSYILSVTSNSAKSQGFPGIDFNFDIDLNGNYWKNRTFVN